MSRFGAPIFAALLAVGLFAPASFAATPATPAAETVPKVVFIVGPAGAATDTYRAQARAAAAIARRYTPDVTELYSPYATWPAVRKALDGASLVVYMGHGNGSPSKYRGDTLYPPTQNGFGLNPSVGGGDTSHQYFGEAAISSQVKLAKNAVVLLNHLCYASGMAEPDRPEATLDQARLRVDNYAAGFIKAGAAAVIAEAWSSPSYFVKAILGGGRSMQNAWQASPSANGHRLAFESKRSPGYIAQMDTETASSGYTRSIVMKTGLAPKDVLAGAAGSPFGSAFGFSLGPTLAATGMTLGTPDIAGLPSAGATTAVEVPFKIKNRKALPKGLQASVRWDPIDTPIASIDPPTEVVATVPTLVTDRTAVDPLTKDPTSGLKAPVVVPAPKAKPRLEAPVEVLDLVVPERVGDVVAPAAVKIGKTALTVPVTLPGAPGRYRLTISLHDADGVAYDAATQALLLPLNVRVTGDFDGAIQVAATAELAAGKDVELGARVTNLGSTDWGHVGVKPTSNLSGWIKAERAVLIARWIPLSLGAILPIDPATHSASADLPIALAPGHSADASLALTAPDTAGQYLLLLDVVTPERGSLLASGVDPTVVRVTVLPTK